MPPIVLRSACSQENGVKLSAFVHTHPKVHAKILCPRAPLALHRLKVITRKEATAPPTLGKLSLHKEYRQVRRQY